MAINTMAAPRLVRQGVAVDEQWHTDVSAIRVTPSSLAALLNTPEACEIVDSITYRALYLLAADGVSPMRVGPARNLISLGHTIRFRAQCDGVTYHCVAYRDVWRQLALIERRAPHARAAMAPRVASVSSVKVMCFNVFNFNEPWELRLEAIVDRVLAADPHVVLLQEVRYKANWVHAKAELRSSRSQIVHIVDALRRRDASQNWQFVYQPSAVYTHGGVQQLELEGVAILSRAPILATDHLFLSRDLSDSGDNPHQRVVLRARVATADSAGAIDFFTTHFSLSEKAQARAVDELAEWLDTLRAADPTIPQVLGGDLNALPSAPAIKRLLDPVGFVDTWIQYLSGNESARTLASVAMTDFGQTFPTQESYPIKRIDFVLVRNVDEVRVPKFEVVEDKGVSATFSEYTLAPDNSMRVLKRQNRTYWASDHKAVFTELELTPTSRSSSNKDEL